MKWYIRYSDCKKSEQVTFSEYVKLTQMAEFYHAIIKSNFFGTRSKTLYVSFPKHFV